MGGATMEAGKNANSTTDPQQLLPKDVRAATTADKIFKQPIHKGATLLLVIRQ